MSTSGAVGISIVWGDSKKRIIESTFDRLSFLIVDLGLIDLADADSAYLFSSEEAELDGVNMKPLAHGLDVVLHCC